MDSRDIEQLTKLLEFKRNLVEAQIKLAGMLAANQSCMGHVTYDEAAFNNLINECHIGFNDFPYYKG